MELHRCRFVPYNPQAINALEFSHPPSSKATGQGAQTLRLAVGRANGDIEIWNPLRGAWFQEAIIRGGKGRCIEGLAWTLDPSEDAADGSGLRLPGRLRLFSIGYTNTVTEWDLEKGRPARHSSGSYGEIWCLTAQPRWTPASAEKGGTKTGSVAAGPADGEYTGQHLAIGCADGSIVILSTADDDLKFVRRLHVSATKNVRVLSITFQNRHVIAAGYADSSIRLFDIRSGRLLRTVSLGRGPVGGPKDVLVWSVKCLPDGTLVSGDSTGEIRFWDAKNYSLVQRLRGHQADVLDVAVSIDGESVISGGADRKTVLYRLKPGKKNDKSRRWAEVISRRYHTHDVKKFAVYESKDISIAVSGGPDASLVVMPLREAGKEHHRTLSSLPQICQLSSGSSSRLMMSFWEREVRIWRIAPKNEKDADSHERNQLVGRVLIPGDDNITSATLSFDGSLLVISTMTTIRMFSLSWNNDDREENEDDSATLDIQDLKIPSQIASDGARVVSLSSDLQWLSIIRPSNEVYLAKLAITGRGADTSEDDREIQFHPNMLHLRRSSGRTKSLRGVTMGTLGDYDRTIRSITFSADSKLLATGDLAGYVDTWALEDAPSQDQPSFIKKTPNGFASDDDGDDDDEDSSDDDEDNGDGKMIEGQRWKSLPTMPCLHAGIVFMSFRPTKTTTNNNTTDDRLLVLTSRHQLTEYEVLQGKFSDWSQRNPKSHLPEDFIGLKDRAIGGVCGIFKGLPKLLLYGPSWLWMFDLTQDFPAPVGDTTKINVANSSNNNNSNNNNSQLVTTAGSGLQKRKRVPNDEDEEERRKYNSGAGDLIPSSQADVTMGIKVRKIESKNFEQEVNAEKHRRYDSSKTQYDDDEDGENSSNPFHVNGEPDFAHLRRGKNLRPEEKEEDDDKDRKTQKLNGISSDKKSEKLLMNGTSFAVVIDRSAFSDRQQQHSDAYGNEDNDEDDEQEDTSPNATAAPQPTIFWHSYKFRDILGVLPLGSGSITMAQKSSRNERWNNGVVELAIVERPMWDMDLGERYVKDIE